MPSLLPEEEFEDAYTHKFDALLHGRGLLLTYARDRAGIDRLFQLTRPGSSQLSNARVAFQLKGKHKANLTLEQYQSADHVAVADIKLELARFWYASPEAVYLVVYIEAADTFIGEDVRDIIDRQWGPSFLMPGTFSDSQATVTLKVRANAGLTPERLDRLTEHRSMRIDGPAFRGRPLGHRLDPLRCTLGALAPNDFVAIVDDLLAAYDFHKEQQLDAGLLLALESGDEARLYIGTFYTTWEWVFQPGTEFGFGENTALRSEGQVFRAFGRVGVLVDARPDNNPEPSPRVVEGIEILRASGAEKLLVFTNADDMTSFHPYRAVAGDLWTVPQGLGSLAYNLLTSTLVFMEHEHRLRWSCVNYRW